MTIPKHVMLPLLTQAEWLDEGERRFGKDLMAWRFVCPACGHVASVKDWKSAGADESAVAFSCVGRWLPGSREAFGGKGPGPCDYAGGGLFRLNPQPVAIGSDKVQTVFAFADAPTSGGAP